MTSLAARALDIETANAQGKENVRNDILKLLMRYLHTDTLLCWAPEKVMNDSLRDGKTLRQLQMETATPIIAHLTTHIWPGVEIKPILEPDSIMPVDGRASGVRIGRPRARRACMQKSPGERAADLRMGRSLCAIAKGI
jgi:hypothetical protein